MPDSPRRTGRRIRVKGLVQGVGFRPHVWRLASVHGIAGSVRNDGEGVEIDAWADELQHDAFLSALTKDAPPLARIDSVTCKTIDGCQGSEVFEIRSSGGGTTSTGVVPDAAACPACLGDIAEAKNRRFGYAFTNCTHCGPRLSIVRAIPYDRANTSMNAFTMCPECLREYQDPTDRRFHAQPNACPSCGPKLWLEDRSGLIDCADPLLETAERLRSGQIAAIKGIGGFHLACDATSEDTVSELRRRKRRPVKPLALMARDCDAIRTLCSIGPDEEAQLRSAAAPIVLLAARGRDLAPSIAPGQDVLGFMLPYTPLHHRLLELIGRPLVFTSGNLSDEPQAITNDDARSRLSGVADVWLMHDREILNRLDDSVVRVDRPGPQILRRARGLAPSPLVLPAGFGQSPPVLAMGGELKASFCLAENSQAILSQHLGDLEEAATHEEFRRTLSLYRDIFRHQPSVIAVDQHPDYLSTQWGQELARENGATLVPIQHHHAHLAACLADNGIALGDDLSVGIILDGLGLGDDGTIWGGEFLVGGYAGFERKGRFAPVPLPGGAQAVREPWRNLVAHLRAAFGDSCPEVVTSPALRAALQARPLSVLDQMIVSGLNSPRSSSAGRLFDAVAAALGLCFERQGYEGQAGSLLECAARPFVRGEHAYPLAVVSGETFELSWEPMWSSLLHDLDGGVETGRIAARFHLCVIEACTSAASAIALRNGIGRVALSGGVFQNQIVHEGISMGLSEAGFAVLTHRMAPANDGGLALGQAVIAAATCRDR